MSRSAWLRVGDMVDAARMAVAWTQGLDRAAFLGDDLRKSGVQWQLLVLGEAAKAVPADIQGQEPGFNWRGAIRLRDFLAHGYSDIDAEALWEIATQQLPRDLPVLTALWNRLEKLDA